MQLADARVSGRPLFSERDRWFESAFLQRRVINEPESVPAGAACSLRWNRQNPQARSHVTIKQTSREPTKPRLRLPLALLISLSR